MRAKEITKHLRRQPFRPLRVYISDGSYYDVRHPELMVVARTEVAIGIDPIDDAVPDELVYCDPVHITRIEPINGRKPQKSKRNRR